MIQRNRLFFVATLFLSGILLSVTGCAPEFEEPSCTTDNECFDGEECRQGVCQAVSGSTEDTGFGGDGEAGEAAVLVVNPEMVEVGVGEQVQLSATGLDRQGRRADIEGLEWSSSDQSVATVESGQSDNGESDPSQGVVTAVANGSVVISATLGDVEATVDVEVVEAQVDRIELSPEPPEVDVNGTVSLSATVYDTADNELEDRQVMWESADEAIATVDDSGTVTGQQVGETEIVATSEEVEASTTVEVVEPQVASVDIRPSDPDAVTAGETRELLAMPRAADDTDLCSEEDAKGAEEPCGLSVEWTTGARDLARVNDSGVVTGKAAGKVRIFATIDGKRDSVELQIEPANRKPTADAGANQIVEVGEQVELDGTGSDDPDGAQTLAFSWRVVSAPMENTASLQGATTQRPTITPDAEGTYIIELEVDDGEANDSDRVELTVEPENQPPVADAGKNQTIPKGKTVTLSGSNSSDPDSAGLTYTWNITSAPSGSSATLQSPAVMMTDLTPDVAGLYKIELTVSDGDVSDTDTVEIKATNQAPTADAGADQTTIKGNAVTITASGSSDPNGDSLSYIWKLSSAPSGSTSPLGTTSGVNTTLNPDVAGDYTVDVTVDDGTDTATDSVKVTATNRAPTADAGSDQETDVSSQVTVDGSASLDPDGDTLMYTWSIISNPTRSTASLGSTSGSSTTLTPDKPGDYVIELEVSDGAVSTNDTIKVTAYGTPASQGDVVVSEIMDAPNSKPDADGEWFELHNASDHPWNLEQCTIEDRGATPHTTTIGSDLRVEPGDEVALAISASPGFTPDYNYSGNLELEDNGDTVAISCNATEIDAVQYDGGTNFPSSAGKSRTLDPGSLDATANDNGSNWCDASSTYSTGDSGTPGTANDTCP